MMYIYQPRSDWHGRSDLTKGKVYDCEWNGEMVYSSTGVYFKLVSDLGHLIEVHESQFVSLDKLRQDKLKELGIK